MRCMYEYSMYGHDNNTLNGDFDARLGDCAHATLTSYTPAELRSCTYGAEGASLRAKSTAKYLTTSYAAINRYDVWVEINGVKVLAPSDTSPRDEWVSQVISAVCEAHDGPMPAACNPSIVV